MMLDNSLLQFRMKAEKDSLMHTIDGITSLFKSQFESSTLHHAWIIEGVEDVVILPIVRDCVSTLLDAAITEANFHPSLYWMNANETKAVDDVRLAIQFLEKTSWDGGWKVCVIAGADQLNAQGQNALLKVVEEPPEKTLIFMVSKRTNMLLPTLYSRGLHLIVTSKGHETKETSTFNERWIDALLQIIDHQNYDALFALQAEMSENEIAPHQQGKWVLNALKDIIDAYNKPTNHSSLHLTRILNVWSQTRVLKRWDAAQRYFADAAEFMIDQKQMCIKLTSKILET
jgi:hypothetical protein